MDFNTEKYFIRNLFSYDISACHYNILSKMGIDVSKFPLNDKELRNIEIGKFLKNNPVITKILRKNVESIISSFILINKIDKEEIILRQYDGIIISKFIRNQNELSSMIELRDIFDFMIISIDRKSYIARSENKKSIIKGVRYRYNYIDDILSKILSLNFFERGILFDGMEKIRLELINSNNVDDFLIPESTISSERKFTLFLKNIGELEISDNFKNYIDVSDIDKKFYFNFYIKPFFDSLLIEFL